LLALGLDVSGDEPGDYASGTEAAVRAFQAGRGLRDDGICGRQTWSALVEAGHAPGDRLLYLRFPMLRGDDVAALQRRLGALGFNAGRVDGMFGVLTEGALRDFQRNAGITVDGICGPATLSALARLGQRAGSAEPVAGVHEVERLRRGPRSLQGRKIIVGSEGGAGALVASVGRALTAAGAVPLVVEHPDGSEQAAQANAADADAFVGVAIVADQPGCTIAYYAGRGWASPAGRQLAEQLHLRLPSALQAAGASVIGMATPVLTETRMPAVICEMGPASSVVERGTQLAGAVADALAAWITDCA
jgi:N-acetylmuramoyl-L-alanine amidase